MTLSRKVRTLGVGLKSYLSSGMTSTIPMTRLRVLSHVALAGVRKLVAGKLGSAGAAAPVLRIASAATTTPRTPRPMGMAHLLDERDAAIIHNPPARPLTPTRPEELADHLASSRRGLSVFTAELSVVPADDFLRDDLEHDAFRRAGHRARLGRRRIRLRLRPRLERSLHRVEAFEDLAVAPDHRAAELSVRVAAFHHQRHLGVASDVHDLLRLPVRGHVESAVPGEVIHRHDVGEPVLVDGGKRSLLALPEEHGLLVWTELNLLTSVHRHAPQRTDACIIATPPEFVTAGDPRSPTGLTSCSGLSITPGGGG